MIGRVPTENGSNQLIGELSEKQNKQMARTHVTCSDRNGHEQQQQSELELHVVERGSWRTSATGQVKQLSVGPALI